MNHPFVRKLQNSAYYGLLWMSILVAHMLVLQQVYGFSVSDSLFDSLAANLSFAILGFSIWFPVRYIPIADNSLPKLIIGHVLAAFSILAVWFIINRLLLNSYFDQDSDYLLFIKNTQLYRIILAALYYAILLLIYILIQYYDNLQEKLLHEIELKASIKEAELNYLKAQINPHFIFNSLNSISSLTITKPEKAQDMILKLSDYLRYSLKQSSTQLSDLRTEMDNIRLYLEIEKIRFGDRLTVRMEVSEELLQQTIPNMILQPLLENAIKHGVQSMTESTSIHIQVLQMEGYLRIQISNDYDPEMPSRKGAGIGLQSVQDRLRLIYKQHELLQTKSENNQFLVEILIPQTN